MIFNKSIYDKVFEKWKKGQKQLSDLLGQDIYLRAVSQVETYDTDPKKTHAMGNGVILKVSVIKERKLIGNVGQYSFNNPEEKKIYGDKILYTVGIELIVGIDALYGKEIKSIQFYESKLFDTFEDADKDRENLLKKLTKSCL